MEDPKTLDINERLDNIKRQYSENCNDHNMVPDFRQSIIIFVCFFSMGVSFTLLAQFL